MGNYLKYSAKPGVGANLVFALVMEKRTGSGFAQRVGEHKVRPYL
ncbi:MAG: hypothetical protein JETT_3948 [Candidatus Jettenia ecosi]|uniref:Uncharacterized protein n=1 Tax=Candidatus Jettenia ecosi TaxID=2494326 RepID=A0A533Q5I9_9BACT|nr:MAG: hypothetical protein JETT_3948 [Candidatus Jettenia ecosi]